VVFLEGEKCSRRVRGTDGLMPLKGGYLFLAGIGGLFAYSGLKGKSLSSALRDVISGQSPANALAANGITSGGGGSSTAGFESSATIEALWVSCGGSSATKVIASQIAMAESGGSPTITSSNPDGGTNVGLWQLDTRGVGSGYTVSQLQNPVTNCKITIRATGNGVNWSEWSDPVANSLPGHQFAVT
jgi:Lysozyme like domain